MSYIPQHIPVLLDEVVNALSINNHEYYIDATFGLGGYTKAILNKKDCKVIAFDRDPEAIKALGDNGQAIADYFIKSAPRMDYIRSGINNQEVYENFLNEVAGNLTRNQVPNYAYIGRTGRALRQTPFGNFIAFPLEIMRTGNNILQRSIRIKRILLH